MPDPMDLHLHAICHGYWRTTDRPSATETAQLSARPSGSAWGNCPQSLQALLYR